MDGHPLKHIDWLSIDYCYCFKTAVNTVYSGEWRCAGLSVAGGRAANICAAGRHSDMYQSVLAQVDAGPSLFSLPVQSSNRGTLIAAPGIRHIVDNFTRCINDYAGKTAPRADHYRVEARSDHARQCQRNARQ